MVKRFVGGTIPERFVEVDAARLLLILSRFARPIDDSVRRMSCFPDRGVERHFTPEYYLQKLDFLVRYPGYLAYELIELHRMELPAASDRAEMIALVRTILAAREPEMMTLPFRRFWRGAYERLDAVESWWHSRGIVFRGLELKGEARPQKHYFLTALAESESQRLIDFVEHAKWYDDRIAVIHRFFGELSPARIKELQYSHEAYRMANLNEVIPDLVPEQVSGAFSRVFGEPLGVKLD